MSEPQPERRRDYWADCARLLYWAYFKPYTYENWLRSIHQELGPLIAPFVFRDSYDENPALRRFASQTLILLIVPVALAIVGVCTVTTIVTGSLVQWLLSTLFFMGWCSGVWLVV